MGNVIRVDVDTRRLQAEFDRLARAVPGAAARALNTTARAVQKLEKAEIARVFQSPTPYVKNSPRVWYAKATVEPLQAEVRIMGGSARALEAEIKGGKRAVKPFEQVMREAGVLPSGKFVVPGQGAKMDRYGNLDGDQLAAILNSLGVLSQQSQNKRRGRKRSAAFAKAASYFVITKGRGGPNIGLFARAGSSVVPVLYFVDNATYSPRFDFFGKGMAEIRRTLPIEIARQLQRIRGARP